MLTKLAVRKTTKGQERKLNLPTHKPTKREEKEIPSQTNSNAQTIWTTGQHDKPDISHGT
jgi:hypothetical protein